MQHNNSAHAHYIQQWGSLTCGIRCASFVFLACVRCDIRLLFVTLPPGFLPPPITSAARKRKAGAASFAAAACRLWATGAIAGFPSLLPDCGPASTLTPQDGKQLATQQSWNHQQQQQHHKWCQQRGGAVAIPGPGTICGCATTRSSGPACSSSATVAASIHAAPVCRAAAPSCRCCTAAAAVAADGGSWCCAPDASTAAYAATHSCATVTAAAHC